MNLVRLLLDTTLIFRLSTLSWSEVIDLLLVAIVFYLFLSLVRSSRAAFFFRGLLVLGGLLFIITIILPLPAFDWLVRGALIAVLVTTPIIFQPELRRLLERIGRSAGVDRQVRRTAVEELLRGLVRAVENMSANYTGALIVMEGNSSLQDVVETGVPIGGQVTSELLQAIFYPSNPLHDGAVILREDRVIAAGCVLPLTQRPLHFQRRLGTRHRAAVGLSEHSDALVIVVSEETGQISIAHNEELLRPLDIASLRKHLFDFYAPVESVQTTLSLRSLAGRLGRWLWRHPPRPTLRQLLFNIVLLLLSLLLAVTTWTFVVQRTNPATRQRFDNIVLQVTNVPADTKLVTQPPSTVSAVVETTDRVRPTLSSRSFQAVVSLEGLSSGLHHLPVQINSSVTQVRILSADPPALDLELAPIVTHTLPVLIDLSDQQNLSRAYQVVGTPLATPNQVTLVGAEPQVSQVSQVVATVSLANVSASLREMRSLRALDEAGHDVTGITLQPAQVQVSVFIQRRVDAKEVGVRVITEGTPTPGYWLSGLNVTPANVTLQGNPEQLAQLEGFVDTLPVDISNAAGDLTIQIPLNLPPSIQVVDSNGNTAKTVTAQVQISARRGSLAVTRPVKLLGVRPGLTASVTPTQVDLLLSGPLPTLNQIEANPDLIQVTVDATGLSPDQTSSLTPTIIAPDGIQAQSVPPKLLVRLSEPSSRFGRGKENQ